MFPKENSSIFLLKHIPWFIILVSSPPSLTILTSITFFIFIFSWSFGLILTVSSFDILLAFGLSLFIILDTLVGRRADWGTSLRKVSPLILWASLKSWWVFSFLILILRGLMCCLFLDELFLPVFGEQIWVFFTSKWVFIFERVVFY